MVGWKPGQQVPVRSPLLFRSRRSTRTSRSRLGGAWLTRQRWGGSMRTATCPGSPGSLGSLSLRLRVRGRRLLTLVSHWGWISLRWRRRQLSPSAVLCSRRPPGRLRKSQGIWRCSQSIPDGHELAFQMRSPPSRGAWLANGRRGSREPWEIRRRQIPNGAACRGWRSIWKRWSGASPSRCRVGTECWIGNVTPQRSSSGCSWGGGTTPKASAGGSRQVTLATECHPWHRLQECQNLYYLWEYYLVRPWLGDYHPSRNVLYCIRPGRQVVLWQVFRHTPRQRLLSRRRRRDGQEGAYP